MLPRVDSNLPNAACCVYQNTEAHDALHGLMFCFFEIHFSIVLTFTPPFLKWSLPSKIHNYNSICISHLSHACYLLSSLDVDLMSIIIYGEKLKLWSHLFCNFFHPPRVMYSLRDMRNEYNILVRKLEGKILFHSYSVHNIKMNFRELVCRNVDWNSLPRLWTFVNTSTKSSGSL